jgi:hypothetical protein
VLSIATLPLEEFPSEELPFSLNHCAQVLFYKINTELAEPTDTTADFDYQVFIILPLPTN